MLSYQVGVGLNWERNLLPSQPPQGALQRPLLGFSSARIQEFKQERILLVNFLGEFRESVPRTRGDEPCRALPVREALATQRDAILYGKALRGLRT